ncbi:hypothetical protein H0H87_011783 [Tephrocybe sp. NHM501043]|nr:hypothetical protein H0H87_011783 [Tephrocybe sp. NHM501043]
MNWLVSRATVTAVGLTCKAVLNLGFSSVAVDGIHNLHNALRSPARNAGQGIITGLLISFLRHLRRADQQKLQITSRRMVFSSRNISSSTTYALFRLDDPVTWGVLPARYYLSSRTTRWALGASDVMFTNPLVLLKAPILRYSSLVASIFSAFFRHGQTLETFRGKGVHQPAVDTAIQKLDQGEWVHLYGEGKINQPETYQRDVFGVARLSRFKWGVGRILMETSTPPVIIPMWLTGFDQLMPEGRSFPFKYLPRYGAQLSVTFGSPIPSEEILDALGSLELKAPPPDAVKPTGWVKDKVKEELQAPTIANEDLLKIRADVTAVIQRHVEALGRSICGDTLTR